VLSLFLSVSLFHYHRRPTNLLSVSENLEYTAIWNSAALHTNVRPSFSSYEQ
jgi:hypothetical protein